MTKVCTRCNEPKPFELFNKRASSKDGLSGSCKECYKAYRHSYRANRSDELRAKDYAYTRAWQAANCDLVREYERAHYHKHKELQAAKSKKWRGANKEWTKNYNAQYQGQAQCKERRKLDRDNLTDVYVRKKIAWNLNIAGVEIPPELIEAKRQHLKIYRTLKETLK